MLRSFYFGTNILKWEIKRRKESKNALNLIAKKDKKKLSKKMLFSLFFVENPVDGILLSSIKWNFRNFLIKFNFLSNNSLTLFSFFINNLLFEGGVGVVGKVFNVSDI